MRRRAAAPVRRRLTKEERRGRILDAASRVFAERGYEGASIDEIADEAGITRPVVYDHFDSKRELHIALLELHVEQLLVFLAERVAGETSGEGQLRAGFEAFFEFVETHPYAWRILFRDPPPADDAIGAAHRRVQERVTQAVMALLAANPPEQPSESIDREVGWAMWAQIIKNAAHGLAFWWYEHREVTREDLVSMTMNALWLGFERYDKGERWGSPTRATTDRPS